MCLSENAKPTILFDNERCICSGCKNFLDRQNLIGIKGIKISKN